jgi:D-amino-acid oxidase
MRVLGIGCGVSGLSCGVRLLEAGHAVSIRAREFPPYTTSDVAAAVWYPYLAAPRDRVLRWGARSYQVFLELAPEKRAGVTLRRAVEVLDAPSPDPWWSSAVEGFEHAREDELPPGYADGYAYNAPVIEMSLYLPWLMERFGQLGGVLQRGSVLSLKEVLDPSLFDAVVNCTGLGARELVGDTALFPIQGEILRVDCPRDARLIFDESPSRGMSYVIPRSGDCVLGGTAVPHSESLAHDPVATEEIRTRCARLVPGVGHAPVLGHAVGLRPGRDEIRLEREQLEGWPVVHNYGHGGAGVTLSWGCAEEVVGLLTP